MTSNLLKIIALLTMIIDHTGAIIFPSHPELRIIGRIAFPIYCFLLIEGYTHTKDVKRYGLRLLLFAFISEIPFDYAFYGGISFSHQNIFFTLTLGLFLIYMMDHYFKTNPLTAIIGMIAAVFLSEFLNTDYGLLGMVYIVIFYSASNMPKYSKLFFTFTMIYIFSATLSFGVQPYAVLSTFFIAAYNGKKGASMGMLKYGFYAAYPLHLLILYGIQLYIQ